MADQFSALELLLDPNEDLTKETQRKALAATLRRQNAYGTLGQLMGVQPTVQAGQAIQSGAQDSLKMALAKQQAAKELASQQARQAVEDQRWNQTYQQGERRLSDAQANQAASQANAAERLRLASEAAAAAAAAKTSAADIKADDAARKGRKDQDVVLSALRTANEGLEDLNVLLKHPGRQAATGKSFLLGNIPGTSARDYKLLADKLANSAFMQAREGLKGAGAVTDFEGAKAQQAITILGDPTATEEQHLQALYDFQDVLNGVREKNAIRARELGIPDELMQTTIPKRKPAAGTQPQGQPVERKTVGGKSYVKVNGEWFEE
jgi:hypothetical protein